MYTFFFRTTVFLVGIYFLLCVIYYLIQEKIIFLPEKLPADYQFNISLSFEEVFLDTEKDVTIHGLHFKKSNSKGVILYFHGNAGSLERWGDVAHYFDKYPYDFFIYDYRTYGKSNGKRSEEAMYYDAEHCLKYLLSTFSENQLILYGRSLGSGIAAKMATLYDVNKVILETPYYNLYDVARHYAPFIPYKLLMRYSFRSDLWLPKIKCPVYIFHGTKDKIIPHSSALKLAEKLNGQGKFVSIPKGRHNNLAEFELFNRELNLILSDIHY
ncbi:MAG: alpha/beta fold hydrolase [Bacteroidota bacterium]